jgi:hypothetical protein
MFLRLEASCQSKKGLKRKCFSIFAKIQNFAKFRFRENSKHFHFHDNYLTLYFLFLYLSKRTLSGTDRLNLVLYETVRLTTWEQESKRLLCRSNYSCTGLRILRYIYILFVPIYSWNPVANHDACYRASILATNHVSLLFPRQPIMMLVTEPQFWPPIKWTYCSPANQSWCLLQSPYYWPSQHHTPDNIEYAIYLYKRAQRRRNIHGLEPGLPVSGAPLSRAFTSGKKSLDWPELYLPYFKTFLPKRLALEQCFPDP